MFDNIHMTLRPIQLWHASPQRPETKLRPATARQLHMYIAASSGLSKAYFFIDIASTDTEDEKTECSKSNSAPYTKLTDCPRLA